MTTARELSTAELRAFLQADLRGMTPGEIRGFATELGISVAELRELVVSTCPSAEQTERLLAAIAASSDEAWLHKVRERATGWNIDSRGSDPEAERRAREITAAAERRIMALRPPPSPPRNPQ